MGRRARENDSAEPESSKAEKVVDSGGYELYQSRAVLSVR